jgi:hypothetical protein
MSFRRLSPGWLFFIVFAQIACFAISGLTARAFGGDSELTVLREENKTTYTIDSDKSKIQDQDREKSWEMLNNMNILIDRRDVGNTRDKDGQGQDNSR